MEIATFVKMQIYSFFKGHNSFRFYELSDIRLERTDERNYTSAKHVNSVCQPV